MIIALLPDYAHKGSRWVVSNAAIDTSASAQNSAAPKHVLLKKLQDTMLVRYGSDF